MRPLETALSNGPLCFSLGFHCVPLVFLCASLVCLCVSIALLWFPQAFPLVSQYFPWLSNAFPSLFPDVPMHVLGFPMHFHLFFYDFPWFPGTLSSFETSGIAWGLGPVALCYPLLPLVTLCYRAGFPPCLRFCTIWGNFETAGTLTLYNTN